FLGRHRSTDDHRFRPRPDRRRVRHMIDMSMADHDHVRALDVGGLEAERRIHAATIEICIEQQYLSVVYELEIGVAGPSDGERLRTRGKGPTGRNESRDCARRIAGLHYLLRIASAGTARIGKRSYRCDAAARAKRKQSTR